MGSCAPTGCSAGAGLVPAASQELAALAWAAAALAAAACVALVFALLARLGRSRGRRFADGGARVKSVAAVTDPLWSACGLSREDVERFGRQLVLARVGVQGQRALLGARVLVVGAGGLGCPVALYLCAAGVGCLGIADGDTVAASNLHRQIGHSCHGVGENKAESLRRACLAIHGRGSVIAHTTRLSGTLEAAELMEQYDLVVDCTDAPPSRYLLSDAAVHAGRPLVAASAVALSGQLAIYNFDGGPCLRCVFPTPPGTADATETVASCEENGVLGPVVGVVGSLAALEAVKLLAGGGLLEGCMRGRLLLYDATDAAQPCRSLKIKKRPGCEGCGRAAGSPPPVELACARVQPPAGICAVPALSAAALARRLCSGQPTVVVDVRQRPHFDVSSLSGSRNWPLPEMELAALDSVKGRAELLGALPLASGGVSAGAPGAASAPLLVCVCRRGNDSLRGAARLRDAGFDAWNLEGGLQAFAAACEEHHEADLEVPPIT